MKNMKLIIGLFSTISVIIGFIGGVWVSQQAIKSDIKVIEVKISVLQDNKASQKQVDKAEGDIYIIKDFLQNRLLTKDIP